MRKVAGVLLVCALALVPLRRAAAAERVLHGRIVDAEGRGVAAVEVATGWTLSTTGAKALAGVKTDAEGRFALPLSRVASDFAVVAYDASRARGAFVAIDPGSLAKEQVLTLVPTVRVSGSLSSKEGKYYPAGGVLFVAPAVGHTYVLRLETTEGKFAAPLPAGTYRMDSMAPGRKPITGTLDVPSGKPTLELEKVDLKDRDGGAEVGELAPPIRVKESHPTLDAALVAGHFPDRWTLFYFWDVT